MIGGLRGRSNDVAGALIDKSKDKGFVFLQVMLMGAGDGTKTNVSGQKPWTDNNPLRPNEPYFQNVDAVVQAARERSMVLVVMLYHQTCRKRITVDNARPWAAWLARRYQATPNIVWSLTPEAKPVTGIRSKGKQERGRMWPTMASIRSGRFSWVRNVEAHLPGRRKAALARRRSDLL